MYQKEISLEDVYKKLLSIEASLKNLKNVEKMIEDLEFARRTEEAWQEIAAGKGKTYSLKDFKKRLNG